MFVRIWNISMILWSFKYWQWRHQYVDTHNIFIYGSKFLLALFWLSQISHNVVLCYENNNATTMRCCSQNSKSKQRKQKFRAYESFMKDINIIKKCGKSDKICGNFFPPQKWLNFIKSFKFQFQWIFSDILRGWPLQKSMGKLFVAWISTDHFEFT